MNPLLTRILLGLRAVPVFFESRFDRQFLAPDVPLARTVSHASWRSHLQELGNKPGMRVLELGSREVTREAKDRREFSRAEYVGFDDDPGQNVDVVGDAHALSSFFGRAHFDLVFSTACFEHFAMPWVVAAEIAKILKVGGWVFVETHFSFSSHERPWHFFQFSDLALKVLFPEALGFKCLEAGMSNPLVGRFSSLADAHLRNRPVAGLYCHSAYLGRKTRDVTDFDWARLDPSSVVGDSRYPRGEA